jgi:hypothetical protein
MMAIPNPTNFQPNLPQRHARSSCLPIGHGRERLLAKSMPHWVIPHVNRKGSGSGVAMQGPHGKGKKVTRECRENASIHLE